MTTARRRWILLTVLSGLAAAGSTAVMLVDHVQMSRRAPAEAGRVNALSETVRSNPGAAVTLQALRDSLTTRSMARENRNYWLAWTLLLAGGLCVAGARRLAAERPPAAPPLDVLVRQHLDRASAESVAPGAAGASRVSKAPGTDADPADCDDFVDGLVARLGASPESAIPILQAIQSHYRYLPDDVLRRVCAVTHITPAQIAGTSSFYAQFRRSPVGRHLVRVCHGTACHVAGIDQVAQELRRHLAIPPGEDTDPEKRFTLEPVACLGCCSLAPVMMVEDRTAGRLTPASARRALDALRESA